MNVTYLRTPKKQVALWLLLMILAGPLLPTAYGLKRWANASSFDRPDRWASVRAFAVMAALPYLALGLLLLSPPLAEQKSQVVLWVHQHGFFEPPSLWSLVLGSLLLLWLLMQPSVFWLTFLLQELNPENALQYTRVVLPGEIPAPRRVTPQPIAIIPAPVPPPAQQKPKRHRTTSSKKKEKPVPVTVKLQLPEEPAAQTTTGTSAGHSLWAQTDWSMIPDDDPVKQLALEEARQRQSSQIRFVEPPSEAEPSPMSQEPPADAPAQKKRIDWSKVDE